MFTEYYFELGYERGLEKEAGIPTETVGAVLGGPFSVLTGSLGYLINDAKDAKNIDDSAWFSNLFLPGVGGYRLGKRLAGYVDEREQKGKGIKLGKSTKQLTKKAAEEESNWKQNTAKALAVGALGLAGAQMGRGVGAIPASLKFLFKSISGKYKDEIVDAAEQIKKHSYGTKLRSSVDDISEEMFEQFGERFPYKYAPENFRKGMSVGAAERMLVDVGLGNAFMLPGIKNRVPSIIAPSKVGRSKILHEIGHTLQKPENVKDSNLFNAITGKTVKSEQEAWDIAKKLAGNKKLNQEVMDDALGTYKADRMGARVGGGLGLGLGAGIIAKKEYNKKDKE